MTYAAPALSTTRPSKTTIDLIGVPDALRLMALREGVVLTTDRLRLPIFGQVVPRFELSLNELDVRITVRVNQESPIRFDGERLLAHDSTDTEIATAASLVDASPSGVYSFGTMRRNAPRSWVYDYHTYCCYHCDYCFKESEWNIRSYRAGRIHSYQENFDSCLSHAREHGANMNADIDIVWLCTGSIPDERRELERHCHLADALRKSGYEGEIYLSQVLSPGMLSSESECLRQMTMLHSAGVDRFNSGIEVTSSTLRQQLIRGRKRDISVDDYYRVFNTALEVFGNGKVGSCLLAGIEPAESTLATLDTLANMGVVPAPTVFTPFTTSQLPIPFIVDIDQLCELCVDFRNILSRHGFPVFSGVFSLA